MEVSVSAPAQAPATAMATVAAPPQFDGKVLEEAVNMFYGSTSKEHAAAHEWLQQMQSSPQAWSFVWDLMLPSKVRTPNVDFT